jgi:hypothetical protein
LRSRMIQVLLLVSRADAAGVVAAAGGRLGFASVSYGQA